MTRMEDSKDSKRIKEIQESAQPCFQCGICAASCPVFRVAPEFNPRLAVDEVIRTGRVAVTGREWNCAYCLMCEQRCPMGVALSELLMDIKNLSSHDGKVPPSIVEMMDVIRFTGKVSHASTSSKKKRDDLGLPELPEPDVEEVQKIFELTGAIDRLARYREAEVEPE
ncbi:MAG: 4Fe-4S dicluster domain-containing protein [Candidatus Thorarchaeota archaeon]|nr:4Fe-4S dicluster domain-containing protein [Candidatus Thorarchaeota archaeon]